MTQHKFPWLSVIIFFIPLLSYAQSIIWQLPPTDYDNIEPFGEQLYQVSQKGKIGLIKADGTQVIPVEYEEITKFYEDKALVLRNEQGKTLIGGYLTSQGTFISFTKKYYTLKGQVFYSDGMLSVANERGLVGYLDERGSEAIGFDGSFDIIKPFTEGYASVFKKKGKERKYSLIDKNGEKTRFRIRLGEIYGGTNVFHGKAIIWDTEGKLYTYETSTATCTELKKEITDTSQDYLFCFSIVSGRNRDIPFTTLPIGEASLSPTLGENGLYGYSIESKEIIPPQFSSASAFTNNIAIVTLNGKKGLIRYVEDGAQFSLTVPQPTINYYAGKDVECTFNLSVPTVWEGRNLDVNIKDANSAAPMVGVYRQGTYTFRLKPQESSKRIQVAVNADGLNLWNGEAAYAFKKIEINLHVNITIAGDIANKDDQIPVTANITNPGGESVTAIVHMTGSDTFVEKHPTVTIPAGGSVAVHSYFHVTKDVSNQSVQVTTSKGGSASRSNLKFESYY